MASEVKTVLLVAATFYVIIAAFERDAGWAARVFPQLDGICRVSETDRSLPAQVCHGARWAFDALPF